jgi:hypothetical protein
VDAVAREAQSPSLATTFSAPKLSSAGVDVGFRTIPLEMREILGDKTLQAQPATPTCSAAMRFGWATRQRTTIDKTMSGQERAFQPGLLSLSTSWFE